MTNITLDKVADQLMKAKEFQKTETWLLEEPQGPIGMHLTLKPAVRTFRTEDLSGLLIGCISDYSLLQDNPTHVLQTLKNSNRPGTYMVDGIKSLVFQYEKLRTVFIDDKIIGIRFGDPLNVAEVLDVLRRDLPFNIDTRKDQSQRGIPFSTVYANGLPIMKIAEYQISVPYSVLMEHNMISEGVKLATEITSLIHRDVMFDRNLRTIHLADYSPFFKLLAPQLFDNGLDETLQAVNQKLTSGELERAKEFALTRNSKSSWAKKILYRLKDDYVPGSHIDYVLAAPKSQEIYVRFDSPIDQKVLGQYLKSEGLFLSEPRTRQSKQATRIRKGGGSRIKQMNYTYTEYGVFDSEGKKVATFGRNVMTLYGNENPKAFQTGAKLANDIQENMMIYTPWKSNSDLDSKLLSHERDMVGVISFFEEMYRFFASIPLEQKAYHDGVQPKKEAEWILSTMESSPDTSVPGRFLYVLRELKKYADPSTFSKFGFAQGAQERVQEQYAALQNRIGRFEALVAHN